jgi:hypothetical protein
MICIATSRVGTAARSRIQITNAARHLSSAIFVGGSELADENAGEEVAAEQLRRAATGLGGLCGGTHDGAGSRTFSTGHYLRLHSA